MSFGDRLKEARIQKGYTQEQLATLIGVAKSTLTGYEKGNREPDVFKIKRLINVLGVSADYLLFDCEKNAPDPETQSEKPGQEFSDEEKKIIMAYRDASEKDRATVNMILSEYMGDAPAVLGFSEETKAV